MTHLKRLQLHKKGQWWSARQIQRRFNHLKTITLIFFPSGKEASTGIYFWKDRYCIWYIQIHNYESIKKNRKRESNTPETTRWINCNNKLVRFLTITSEQTRLFKYLSKEVLLHAEEDMILTSAHDRTCITNTN